MPMHRVASKWRPVHPGWGLIDARTATPVDPIRLVTDEKIEMTRWELHDFGVQVVRDYILATLGHELMSSQGSRDVDPSIWFVGDQGPEWVVVRAVRYPESEATQPQNIDEISGGCARLSRTGHFASVVVANADDTFDRTGGGPALPLWRGHAMRVRFEGLVPVRVT